MKCNVVGIFVLFLGLTVKSVFAAAQTQVAQLVQELEAANFNNLRLLETVEELQDHIYQLQSRNASKQAATKMQREPSSGEPIIESDVVIKKTLAEKKAQIVGLKRELKQLRVYNSRRNEICGSWEAKIQKLQHIVDSHRADFESYVPDLNLQLEEKDRQIAQYKMQEKQFLVVNQVLAHVKDGLYSAIQFLKKRDLTHSETDKVAFDLAALYMSLGRALGVMAQANTGDAGGIGSEKTGVKLSLEREQAQMGGKSGLLPACPPEPWSRSVEGEVAAPATAERRVSWGRASVSEIESKNKGRKDFPKSKGSGTGGAKIFATE